MTLTEINLHDIIATFGTHKQFNNEIKEACKLICGYDKLNLYNIMIYYNIAFDCGCDMEGDCLLYQDMIEKTIKSMQKCYKKKPLRIFKFIEIRVSENQRIVNNVYLRRLA